MSPRRGAGGKFTHETTGTAAAAAEGYLMRWERYCDSSSSPRWRQAGDRLATCRAARGGGGVGRNGV